MTHRADVARGRDIVARWCDFAERRLEYLTELFETGRWRRYHTEREFLENIQEAKTAVETWRDLLTREASRDNAAIDMSWLRRSRATRAMQPRGHILSDQVHLFQPHSVHIPAEPPPSDCSNVAEAGQFCSGATPPAPDRNAPVHSSALSSALDKAALDIASLAQRYPLLRNVM
jgi:uncharacterized repeat protein (TIGR03809 family)